MNLIRAQTIQGRDKRKEGRCPGLYSNKEGVGKEGGRENSTERGIGPQNLLALYKLVIT